MNEHDKEIVIEFSQKLYDLSIEFLKIKYPEELDIPEIIDIILSAHLTSTFNLMRFLSSDNKKLSMVVNKFIYDIKEALNIISPLTYDYRNIN